MFNDTSLVRMVIEDISERHGWTYEETMDRFYSSKTCKGLSERETGIFTFAPREVADLFEEVDMKARPRHGTDL